VCAYLDNIDDDGDDDEDEMDSLQKEIDESCNLLIIYQLLESVKVSCSNICV
jgi:hypothetical protein